MFSFHCLLHYCSSVRNLANTSHHEFWGGQSARQNERTNAAAPRLAESASPAAVAAVLQLRLKLHSSCRFQFAVCSLLIYWYNSSYAEFYIHYIYRVASSKSASPAPPAVATSGSNSSGGGGSSTSATVPKSQPSQNASSSSSTSGIFSRSSGRTSETRGGSDRESKPVANNSNSYVCKFSVVIKELLLLRFYFYMIIE